MNSITASIIAVFAIVAILAITGAAVLYSKLSNAEASIAELRVSVAKTESDLKAAEVNRKIQVEVLSNEAKAATAAAEKASEEILAIQKDIQDGLDAPSAPLWHRFEKTASPMRPMAIPRAWVLIVVVRGHVEGSTTLPSEQACTVAAFDKAAEIIARPEFVGELKGHVSLICAQAPGRTA